MDEIIQGSPEWHAARLGRVTASRVADVIAKTKSGASASRGNYLAQLVAERLTGTAAESFTNAAMQWGTDQEARAREAYAFFTGSTVSEIGFAPHPTIAIAGASPDGLVDENGLVEIKCPNTATHIETLLGSAIPAKYEAQMLWQMACTGRAWCDFVSFDPRMPADMQLFIKRMPRDEERISKLENEVQDFLNEVGATVHDLIRTYREAA
jgi:putative phage-type endonuclease